jgi:hypothetical protein
MNPILYLGMSRVPGPFQAMLAEAAANSARLLSMMSCLGEQQHDTGVPEEFSAKSIDWSSLVIMGNAMPPRDPDEDEEDDDEDDDEEEEGHDDEPPVVREPNED